MRHRKMRDISDTPPAISDLSWMEHWYNTQNQLIRFWTAPIESAGISGDSCLCGNEEALSINSAPQKKGSK